MTIELDTTLAQAEVLFLSFAQLVADMNRRRAEEGLVTPPNELRRRGKSTAANGRSPVKQPESLPPLSEDLTELLVAGR